MVHLAAYLFGISLLLTLGLTPLAIRLGRRWGVLDHPGGRKVHAEPIPLVGGWVIFGVLSLLLWGHLGGAIALKGTATAEDFPEYVRYFVNVAPSLPAKIAPVYLGALAIFLLGLYDDVKGMSVKSRLGIQIVLTGLLTTLGIRPDLYFLPVWMCSVLGMLWIVGITNAFNFLDGLDGLSAGVAWVATAALLTLMGSFDQPNAVFLLATLAGALSGFLKSNWHPARVFLGSGGSLLLGYLLGVFTIVATYTGPGYGTWMASILTPVFILAIPIYDTASVVFIRLVQKRPVAIGDQSHFHHRLLRLGFSHRQTVAFIILIALSIALSAVWLPRATPSGEALIVLQIAGIFSILILAERVARRLLKRDEPRPRHKHAEPVKNDTHLHHR